MSRYIRTRRILALSTLYQHGKTQVPKEVRRLLNLRDGDKLLWLLDENGSIHVEKA